MINFRGTELRTLAEVLRELRSAVAAHATLVKASFDRQLTRSEELTRISEQQAVEYLAVGVAEILDAPTDMLTAVQKLALAVLRGEPCGRELVDCLIESGVVDPNAELAKRAETEAAIRAAPLPAA